MPKKTPALPPEPPGQVILEDIQSQNRATLEAVESFQVRYQRDRADDRANVNARFDVVEGVLREHSKGIRELRTDVGQLNANVAVLKVDVADLKVDVAVLKDDVALFKTDVAEIKTTLRRVDGKVDHLSTLEPRVAALERSGD